MESVPPSDSPQNFVLTGEALEKALPNMSMATKAIHADDFFSPHRAIAPAMQVSVNYRYTRSPNDLVPMDNVDPNAPNDSHIYSRYTAPNTSRFEIVLRNLFGGGGVVSFPSGLAAFHAIMVLLNPKRIFIGEGYHGVHRSIKLMSRLTNVQKLSLDDLDQLGPGDILHIETPLNPTGEACNLAYYSQKAREAGAYLTVDATFAPPPLQNPLQFGTDIVMHSGTKYIGGHSDMLCGILVVNETRVKEGWLETLYQDRRTTGSVMGSLEGWLGIRSLRTLHLRVTRQSQTAEKLVAWMSQELQDPTSLVAKLVEKVQHASLQHEDLKDGWLRKQMPGGFGPVFSFWMKNVEHARRLPSRLYIFQHATSLGGVESLVEWRAMSDEGRNPKLMRVSCGVEDVEDMKADLLQAFESLQKNFLDQY
ncbi:Cys/Met metabolism PLP-dependent enzyme-domain-containing protein [Ilyonectria destructans]|nr:cystathionine beta-lyase [Ilyonectria sp. MPI-CAGE-AT-0026]KAH6983978.1 Cys/Met metabolism PLP-dependent enzyme-domain-containing protein [Ilyonectria destructans]